MGRRESPLQPLTESEQEEAARLAEGRRSSAEQEMIGAADTKKNLEAKIVQLNDDIEKQKILFGEIREKAQFANDLLLKIQKEIANKKAEFETIKKEYSEAETELIDFRAKAVEEKNKISIDISAFSKDHEEQKKTAQQELQFIADSKQPILDDIKEKITHLENLKKEEADQEAKNTATREASNLLTKEKINLEVTVSSLEKKCSDLTDTIENKKSESDQMDTDAISKKNESATLSLDIENKKTELKALEQKAFQILKREDALNNKEAFIKSQYERAGIAYE